MQKFFFIAFLVYFFFFFFCCFAANFFNFFPGNFKEKGQILGLAGRALWQKWVHILMRTALCNKPFSFLGRTTHITEIDSIRPNACTVDVAKDCFYKINYGNWLPTNSLNVFKLAMMSTHILLAALSKLMRKHNSVELIRMHAKVPTCTHKICEITWGGDPHWKVVWGCATLKTPFSDHFLALETHHLKPFSNSRDPTSVFLGGGK